MTTHTPFMRAAIATVAAGALMFGTVACSSDNKEADKADKTQTKTVTLVTHNDFALPDELIADFEKDSGLTLKQVQAESGAQLVNKLNLTKDNPMGDVVFGIATNDIGMVANDKLLADPGDISLSDGADTLVDKTEPHAVPIDRGDLCVNYDVAYFADHNLPEPKTFEDLAKPEYKDLFVTIDASKVTGFGFLAATIAHFGDDGWQDYWKDLKDNGVKVDPGWSEAYNQDFTQGEGHGKYPIVVSYASSPAFTVNDDTTASTTKAMLDTCYQQVEYAGVLDGAANPEGAKKVIEWLLSPDVQAAIPDSMYMFPVDSSVELSKEYKFAPLPEKSLIVPSKDVADNQEQWVKTWTDIVS